MPPRLRQIPSNLLPTDIQVSSISHPKRQSTNDATTGIIPTSYPTDGAQPGTVAGITLGVVAGVILLCILFYFLSTGNKGGGNTGGPSITGTEDIMVRERRRSRSPLRSRSRSPDRIVIERRGGDREKRRSNRKSHKSRRSEQEMRQVSRSPGGQSRRPSRTIVEERVERIPRDRSSQPHRSSNIEVVEERRDDRRNSRPPPPPVAPSRRYDGDDIVEVIEEGSISEPPRKERRSRRQSGDYRSVQYVNIPVPPTVPREVLRTTTIYMTDKREGLRGNTRKYQGVAYEAHV